MSFSEFLSLPPLTKSPNEALPQDTQQEQLSAIVEELKWLKP